MGHLSFKVLAGDYTIHRLAPASDVPTGLGGAAFASISRTDDETTVVCPGSIDLQAEQSNPGWSVLQVIGPLDFSLTGILADISQVLSEKDISLFAISTWDTDYFLIKSGERERAIKALISAGHSLAEK